MTEDDTDIEEEELFLGLTHEVQNIILSLMTNYTRSYCLY